MNIRNELNRAYQKKVLDKLSTTVRATALIVDKELVETTPVDKGRARANWQVNLNSIITTQVDWNDDTKKDTTFIPARENAALTVLGDYKLTDTIYISNNLPYIDKLNNGSSIQAPAGFVDAALAKGKRAITG